jgi:hypothetical protein
MVFGMVNRLYTLVSDEASITTCINASFRHLQRRGYQPRELHSSFNQQSSEPKKKLYTRPLQRTQQPSKKYGSFTLNTIQ